jgi:hypothetical protein
VGLLPPLDSVAINVIEVPEHTSGISALIVIEGKIVALTLAIIILETAVVITLHEEVFVKMHFTASPFERLLVVNTALFPPTFVPLICH